MHRTATTSADPARPRPELADDSLLFIGTATVLIRYAGFTILTDPNFLHRGQRVRLGYGLRSRRRTEPALQIQDLPPLDAVIVSHLHEDHFDRVAERQLDRTVPLVTTPHAATVLRQKGFGAARPLETWQSTTFSRNGSSLRVTSVPGKHSPSLLERFIPPSMGSLLELQPDGREQPLRIYITGDTLIHDDLHEIPRRYPEIDLALLHLGGTRIFGVLLTMDGRQGVQAIRIVGPRHTIPIHYNDYTVFKSPLAEFQQLVRTAGLEDRVSYLRHGESYRLTNA